jgi:hypothetical protein
MIYLNIFSIIYKKGNLLCVTFSEKNQLFYTNFHFKNRQKSNLFNPKRKIIMCNFQRIKINFFIQISILRITKKVTYLTQKGNLLCVTFSK